MKNILLISGRKQSGKSTLTNYIMGHILQKKGLTDKFVVDVDGKLRIQTNNGMGTMDLDRKDIPFTRWASASIWPFVKNYSFADELKRFLMVVFGLRYEQCYGSNADKETATKISWDDISKFVHAKKVSELRKNGLDKMPLSARQLLQIFGTDICRKIKNTCWIDACFNQVLTENSQLAIINDCRFKDELDRSKEIGAKTIRLDGQFIKEDEVERKHRSEYEMESVGVEEFDLFIENQNLSIDETGKLVITKLEEWEMLPF